MPDRVRLAVNLVAFLASIPLTVYSLGHLAQSIRDMWQVNSSE